MSHRPPKSARRAKPVDGVDKLRLPTPPTGQQKLKKRTFDVL